MVLRWIFAVSALAMAAALAGPAAAHPHVWVTVETTVVYDGGQVTGLQHKWTFDDMYTAMAIQGLDANGDGTYSREELAELAQVNMDGLKEFAYFTVAKLGTAATKGLLLTGARSRATSASRVSRRAVARSALAAKVAA